MQHTHSHLGRGSRAARAITRVIVMTTLACASAGRGAPPATPAPPAAPPTSNAPATGDVHDFDFLTGNWTGVNRRLKVRGVGSNEWDEFPGIGRGISYLGGVVHVEEVSFPTKGWSGLTIRTFDVARRQWAIYWISSKTGVMFPPVMGGFHGDRAEFYGDDEDDGRPVKVRFTWTKLGGGRARWEQAFSYDGRAWETNWTNEVIVTPPGG